MKVFHVWCWKMDIHTSETLLIPKDFWSMFVNFSTSTTTVIFQDHAWKHYFRLLLRNRMIWRILSFESYNESYLKWKRHYMKWKRPLIRYITASRFSNDILQVKTSLIPPERYQRSSKLQNIIGKPTRSYASYQSIPLLLLVITWNFLLLHKTVLVMVTLRRRLIERTLFSFYVTL